MSFILGKIYRYGTVGILVFIALIEAAIFLASVMVRHYIFKRPMSWSLPMNSELMVEPVKSELRKQALTKI